MLLNPYRFQSGPAGLWTPLNMAAVPQVYLDAQDSVVTNVSGACSAISNLGAMGADGAFSQSTAANRPAIREADLNGKRVLRFDGTNDVIIAGSVAARSLLANVGAGWYFAVVKKLALDAPGTTNRIFLNVPKSTAGAARFRVSLSTGAAGTENRPNMQVTPLDAGATANMNPAASQGTVYSMQLVHMNYATGRADIYMDGVIAASNSALTDSGNTSNTASIYELAIGALYTGSVVLPTDADLATIILDRNALSNADIDKLFGWAAHKYGLTASLPSGHPYKTVAPTV